MIVIRTHHCNLKSAWTLAKIGRREKRWYSYEEFPAHGGTTLEFKLLYER
jgi:hypothetical protein